MRSSFFYFSFFYPNLEMLSHLKTTYFFNMGGGQHTTPVDPGLPKPPCHTAHHCAGIDTVCGILEFFRVKNNFFQNCSKLPKNHFRTIKILFFFPDFWILEGWVYGFEKIWKIPDFFFVFETFPKLINNLSWNVHETFCMFVLNSPFYLSNC